MMPPTAETVAATVNGQPIPEMAVYRAVRTVPAAKQKEARGEIVNFLVDNLLVDQFLKEQKVAVEKKEVDARIDEMKAQLARQKQDFNKVLKDMLLDETEFRAHIEAEIRWEKYVHASASDKELRELFAKNPDMFDGTMVHARHILLTPPSGDVRANLEAKGQLAALRKQWRRRWPRAWPSCRPSADKLAREKERTRLLDEAFAVAARQRSACPSKERGGDVGWFPRAGSMVEPFAKAAFALKPYEMSDVVTTQFGHHLILALERKPGKETKFEDVKDDVKEVYASRKREELCKQLRRRRRSSSRRSRNVRNTSNSRDSDGSSSTAPLQVAAKRYFSRRQPGSFDSPTLPPRPAGAKQDARRRP